MIDFSKLLDIKGEDAFLAIVVTTVGGVIIAWVNSSPKRDRVKSDGDQALRQSFQDAIDKTNARLDKVMIELDEWRSKYHQLINDHQALILTCGHLKLKVKALEVQLAHIKDQYMNTEQIQRMFPS